MSINGGGVYLLYIPSESCPGVDVFKIGQTQQFMQRKNNYPADAVPLRYRSCREPLRTERALLQRYTEHVQVTKHKGREYLCGPVAVMMKIYDQYFTDYPHGEVIGVISSMSALTVSADGKASESASKSTSKSGTIKALHQQPSNGFQQPPVPNGFSQPKSSVWQSKPSVQQANNGFQHPMVKVIDGAFINMHGKIIVDDKQSSWHGFIFSSQDGKSDGNKLVTDISRTRIVALSADERSRAQTITVNKAGEMIGAPFGQQPYSDLCKPNPFGATKPSSNEAVSVKGDPFGPQQPSNAFRQPSNAFRQPSDEIVTVKGDPFGPQPSTGFQPSNGFQSSDPWGSLTLNRVQPYEAINPHPDVVKHVRDFMENIGTLVMPRGGRVFMSYHTGRVRAAFKIRHSDVWIGYMHWIINKLMPKEYYQPGIEIDWSVIGTEPIYTGTVRNARKQLTDTRSTDEIAKQFHTISKNPYGNVPSYSKQSDGSLHSSQMIILAVYEGRLPAACCMEHFVSIVMSQYGATDEKGDYVATPKSSIMTIYSTPSGPWEGSFCADRYYLDHSPKFHYWDDYKTDGIVLIDRPKVL